MRLAEFEKVAQILAKEHKITIHEGNAWAANIKKREVYFKKEDIYNLSENHILGLLLHEVAHIHYTTDVKLPKDNQELTHSTMNVLEDIAIEHIIGGDYPNAGDILYSTKHEVLDTLVRLLPKMQNTSEFERSLLYAAVRFEGRGYSFNLERYEKLGEEISKLMISNKNQILNRKETKDLLPLANQIVELLIKELGQPDEQTKMNLKANTENQKASQATEDTNAKKQLINQLQGGKGWGNGINVVKNIAYIDEIIDQSTMIGRELRSVLKRNNAMEFGGRYRTGKLMAKRFVRIKAQKDRRPFARRIVKSNQSYAFAIASDVSGSMFHGGSGKDPASYALSSMQMVAQALRIAGVPRAMIMFGERAHLAVPIGKKQINWSDLANQKNLSKAGNTDTRINKAIDMCVEELNKVRAERKILILLTDGSSNLQAMKESHKKAVEAGIECLGITITEKYGGSADYMNKTFGEKKNRIIEDIEDNNIIGESFISILKESITDSK